MQVGFIDGPVGSLRHTLRVGLQRAPEVCQESISVVDGLGEAHTGAPVGTPEQHRTAAEERLDIVLDRAEPLPNLGRDRRLATEPRERGFEVHAVPRAASPLTDGAVTICGPWVSTSPQKTSPSPSASAASAIRSR